MRIIGGTHRGRKLASPKDDNIRPTTDRVRESLFSILGPLDEVVVIDACAGSGALGCEALSRGAAHVFFFDTAKAAVDLVDQNVEMLGVEDQCTVTLGTLSKLTDLNANLAFVDPPYDDDLWKPILKILSTSDRLADEALCVCEHPSKIEIVVPAGFEIEETRNYSDTTLSFVRWLDTEV